MVVVRTYALLQDEKKSSYRLLRLGKFLNFICAQINMFGLNCIYDQIQSKTLYLGDKEVA